ncbi:hypothetical protein BpHYR1_021936 [Brachionus plicatilis]|uniref:Uncharacterized protein n=1 Tax=Brachionus plicatilis TaxID=10195 RepID=A0A3M7RS06_BRAPC|nr:hypothetical protein BpHYR1_021936 [Brachionus plicatilis]
MIKGLYRNNFGRTYLKKLISVYYNLKQFIRWEKIHSQFFNDCFEQIILQSTRDTNTDYIDDELVETITEPESINSKDAIEMISKLPDNISIPCLKTFILDLFNFNIFDDLNYVIKKYGGCEAYFNSNNFVPFHVKIYGFLSISFEPNEDIEIIYVESRLCRLFPFWMNH